MWIVRTTALPSRSSKPGKSLRLKASVDSPKGPKAQTGAGFARHQSPFCGGRKIHVCKFRFPPFIFQKTNPDRMTKKLILFATLLAIPTAAVVVWMLPSEPQPSAAADEVQTFGQATDTATVRSVHASQSAAGVSKMTRKSDFDFATTAIASDAPALPAAPQIAVRFTAEGNPSDALPRRDAVNGLGLQPTERVRVLPANSLNADSPSSSGEIPAASLILAVDHSLHDPAAWVASEAASTGAQAAVKAKIADDFAAQVSAVAKSPEAATEGMESAWRNAKAQADANYRKMFGDAAFNRASVGAARAAVPRP